MAHVRERWAKRFLGIDRAHEGRDRQGPPLDGRLVPSPKAKRIYAVVTKAGQVRGWFVLHPSGLDQILDHLTAYDCHK